VHSLALLIYLLVLFLIPTGSEPLVELLHAQASKWLGMPTNMAFAALCAILWAASYAVAFGFRAMARIDDPRWSSVPESARRKGFFRAYDLLFVAAIAVAGVYALSQHRQTYAVLAAGLPIFAVFVGMPFGRLLNRKKTGAEPDALAAASAQLPSDAVPLADIDQKALEDVAREAAGTDALLDAAFQRMSFEAPAPPDGSLQPEGLIQVAYVVEKRDFDRDVARPLEPRDADRVAARLKAAAGHPAVRALALRATGRASQNLRYRVMKLLKFLATADGFALESGGAARGPITTLFEAITTLFEAAGTDQERIWLGAALLSAGRIRSGIWFDPKSLEYGLAVADIGRPSASLPGVGVSWEDSLWLLIGADAGQNPRVIELFR